MRKISKDHVVRTFAATHPPAARVQPGEVFVMETNDRFRNWHDGTQWPLDDLTVMTGPVYIEGAAPGHSLAVEILDIRPTQGFGYVVAIPGHGMFKERVEFRKKIVPIVGNRIRYSETISLPFSPMVGKLGVAPVDGPLPSHASGPFGGTLTNSQVGPGTTVYLPVFVPGGLLTIEDVHACMGDGEATASAVEIAAEVTLRCRITEELRLSRPLLVTQEEVLTTGAGETVEAAATVALDSLADLLRKRTGLDDTEIAMLLSVAADVRISYIGGMPYQVRAAIAREILGL
ncbi:MAG: acetamidase/formamidase family protein [Candidatus Binatia bacterium]|nr:acetamidase/formamidase family protein [Candidatus Binatia bacterium]